MKKLAPGTRIRGATGPADWARPVPVDRLRRFATDVLVAAAMPQPDAEIAVDAMIWADLRGLRAHGVGEKLQQVVARISAGVTRPDAPLVMVADVGSLVVADAQNGWGQVAGPRAMAIAVERATLSGVGFVSVRNASSVGAIGYDAWYAARQGLIGMAVTNGPPLMAPWGGRTRLLGNQAYAIATPAGRYPPIVFDSATSVMSTGEMHALAERGKPLPPGVAVDAGGRPSRDPNIWLENGVLKPAGGHRGYGLALMWEVLTGILAGGPCFAPDVGAPGDLLRPQGISLILVAIKVDAAMPLDAYVERVDRLIDAIHTNPPAPGVDRILVPGERGADLAAIREREGIPFENATWVALNELGADLGVAW